MKKILVTWWILALIAAGAEAFSSELPPRNPPEAVAAGRSAADARREALAAEERLLSGLLAGFTDDYLDRLEEAKAKAAALGEAEGFYARGSDEWIGTTNFLKTFAQQDPLFERSVAAARAGTALPPWNGREVDSIKRLDRQLKARGIDLIVAVHPFKEEVYAGRWVESLETGEYLFPEIIPLALDLLREDIEVVYLLPRFMAVAATEEEPELFEPTREMHWTHAGFSIAADAIAERLRRYALRSGAIEHEYRNDDFGRVYDGEALYETDINSPVLIMGDSFTGDGPEYFGLHAQIAKEIGLPTTQLWVSGVARGMPRILAEMGGEYLEGRKVVVWTIGSALFRPLHETPIPTAELPRFDPTAPRPEKPAGQVQVYALVEETSEIPDPAVSLYDDAITVVTLRIQNVEKGDVDGRRVRAAQWVMKQRSLDAVASRITEGDHVRVLARPFDEYQAENPGIETVQRSDDTTDLDLPLYWVDEWHLIKRRVERD